MALSLSFFETICVARTPLASYHPAPQNASQLLGQLAEHHTDAIYISGPAKHHQPESEAWLIFAKDAVSIFTPRTVTATVRSRSKPVTNQMPTTHARFSQLHQ